MMRMMFRKYITTGKNNFYKGVSNMKKILFAASECVPFIKTGGLADVCGALPKEFDKEYWDVRVVIPNYSCIPEYSVIKWNM